MKGQEVWYSRSGKQRTKERLFSGSSYVLLSIPWKQFSIQTLPHILFVLVNFIHQSVDTRNSRQRFSFMCMLNNWFVK